MRYAWAEVDLDAIRHNVGVVRQVVAPATVWAVVKADAYGHGAAAVSLATLEAGAAGLCVALVDEGIELRAAGITAPILVLSEQPLSQLSAAVEHRLTLSVYSVAMIEALSKSATDGPVDVHLKVNTGMNRVGAAPGDAVALATLIEANPRLNLQGVFTHLAMADEPSAPSNAAQLSTFEAVLAELDNADIHPPLIHASNSAAALSLASSRYDMVRLGIAMYGIEPGPELADLCDDLRPVMALKARVGFVRRVSTGEGISYGLRHRFERDTTVATVPIGYADGVPRRLYSTGGVVLIGGKRRPIVGVVTMDQIMVDCGDDIVEIGDEVVLIGQQEAEKISAEDWAEQLDTIGYEIVCGISKRIPRRYLHL